MERAASPVRRAKWKKKKTKRQYFEDAPTQFTVESPENKEVRKGVRSKRKDNQLSECVCVALSKCRVCLHYADEKKKKKKASTRYVRAAQNEAHINAFTSIRSFFFILFLFLFSPSLRCCFRQSGKK